MTDLLGGIDPSHVQTFLSLRQCRAPLLGIARDTQSQRHQAYPGKNIALDVGTLLMIGMELANPLILKIYENV